MSSISKYYTSLKGTWCQKHENDDDYDESTVQVNKYNPILVLHANFNLRQNQQLSHLLDTIATVFLWIQLHISYPIWDNLN